MPVTVNLADGKQLPDNIMHVMCVVQMFIGVPVVTDELFYTFEYRVRMFEVAHKNKGLLVDEVTENTITFRGFTEEELEAFRGARFNVPSKTHAQFKKDMSKAWFDMATDNVLSGKPIIYRAAYEGKHVKKWAI